MTKGIDPRVRKSWEDFLNPDVMRPRLISASIYIAAFEVLRDSIINHIRDFFCTGFDESGDIIDPKYQSKVLVRNRSALYASLDWLKEMEILDDADLATFENVKQCRNTLAHRILAALGSEGLPPEFEQCFSQLVGLLHKIEVWWIVNVEIPTNPDLICNEVDEDGIVPGPIMTIKLLMEIALGDEEKSRYYYEEFLKRIKRNQ